MCFGGGGSAPPPVTPAPAPAPPAPAPVETPIGDARKNENVENFGNSRGPNTRINRADPSVTGGLSGGSGLKM